MGHFQTPKTDPKFWEPQRDGDSGLAWTWVVLFKSVGGDHWEELVQVVPDINPELRTICTSSARSANSLAK